MITISNSKREAFGCQYNFFMKYIKRVPAPVNPNLYEGDFLHELARHYVRKLFEEKATTDLDIFNSVFNNLWIGQNVLSQQYWDNLYKAARFWAERFVLDLDTFYAAELPIGFDLDMQYHEFPNIGDYNAQDEWCEENGIWVHQRLDAVYISGSTAKIADYKSARGMQPESVIKAKGQPRQYAWALFNHPGCHFVDKIIVEFDYMRKGRKVAVEFTRDQVDNMEQELRTFHAKVLSKVKETGNILEVDPERGYVLWPAHQCDTCEVCTYTCPLNDPKMEIPAVIQDDATARKLAEKYIAMKRDISTIAERLKVFTRQRPEIELEPATIGWKTTEMIKGLKADKVIEYLLPMGVDLNLFLSVDTGKISKLQDDEVKSTVLAMGKKIASDRFGFRLKEKENGEDEE